MNIKSFFFLCIVWTAGLIGQENVDSLYQNILVKRSNGNLSIILVDKAITFERQKFPTDQARLSELLFYRGELLQQEKRFEEAILTYNACLSHPGEKWISDKAHFNRGFIYETLGFIKCRRNAEERLVASQLFWFGKNTNPGYSPSEFSKAEFDYQAIENPKAKERLMRLYLVTGKVREAENLIHGLDSLSVHSDDTIGLRIKAYEILLYEAKEDFQAADRLRLSMGSKTYKQLDMLLNEIRTKRLENPIHFDWFDRTAHEVDAVFAKTKCDVESRQFSTLHLNYSLKRLMFESVGGGFLVTAKVGAFGLINNDRSGLGVNLDALGTFLNKNISAPGGGFSFDFESYKGSGKRILKIDNKYASEKSESGFGFNLNAGIRHKLFAFVSYNQRSAWLNGLSDQLSIAEEMFDSLGIRVLEARRTKGVYGMGSASMGWWPGKTNIHSSDKNIGFNTNLSSNIMFGAAYLWLNSDLTDHDELTVNNMSRTYAHNIFFNERIALFKLNAEMRFDVSGLWFALGGHHSFECSSEILFSDRSAQIVKSVPEPNGIHEVLLNCYGKKLNSEEIAYVKKITGYLPSASRLYLKLNYSHIVFTIEYIVNGLRAKNTEIRFSLGIKPREKFMSQCLHDLALWR